MRVCIALALLIPLAACSGESPSGPADAKPMGDASTSAAVMEVTCPSGTLPTVETMGPDSAASYSPMVTTIPVGGIVKFVMPIVHNVAPDIGTDAKVRVDYRQTKCLKFMSSGMFKFRCEMHGFPGSITVQ
jgi:plastocyanin